MSLHRIQRKNGALRCSYSGINNLDHVFTPQFLVFRFGFTFVDKEMKVNDLSALNVLHHKRRKKNVTNERT